jgi:acyl carrier protein
MSDAVAEKVISTLASVKRIPADTIKLDTNLQDLGIDSLDVFTLLFELENAFKISIPDDDVRSLRWHQEDTCRRAARHLPGLGHTGELTNGLAPSRHHRIRNYFPAGTKPGRQLEILERRPPGHWSDQRRGLLDAALQERGGGERLRSRETFRRRERRVH